MDRWLDSVLFVFTDSFMFCREELDSSAAPPPVPALAAAPSEPEVAVPPAPLSAPLVFPSARFYSFKD